MFAVPSGPTRGCLGQGGMWVPQGRRQANAGLARQHSLFLFACQEVFSNANASASARAAFFVFLDFLFCFAFNRSSGIYILQIQIINESN